VGEERHRILAAMAHPDDVEYSCAAAIAQWVSEGCDVHYLMGTCGEAGMEDPEWTPERTARTREGEQRRAAEMVGVDSVEFLDYPDGRVMRPRRSLVWGSFAATGSTHSPALLRARRRVV
jgi:LmbE family N-acetylglucosaminyl deacetylase